MKEKDILKSRDGFTLIEIIVVLVILSIISVVVAVKYVDITSDSQQTAVDTVLFDAAARYNMAYAKYMLLNPDKPTELSNVGVLSGEEGTTSVTIEGEGDVGDFKVIWSGTSAGGIVTITVTGITVDGPSWFNGFTGIVTKTFPFHPSD
ncbi:type II secretion system GspH family protein [bacterium]|nr:type II secretion system GspH family protein [bacterium]